jgi:GWxTD domain-containing protein
MVAPLGVVALLACATTPRDSSDVVENARAHLAQGDTAAATTALEAGGALDATDPAAAGLLGELYRDRNTIQGRLRSQSVLEDAHARFPDDTEVAMELATTYFAQGFYPDAVRILRGVLARDPQRCDARVLLGLYYYQNWKRMNEYSDDLADARRELRAAVKCRGEDPTLALRYLIAGYAQNDSIRSECDDFIARFPERPEFHLMRGALAFEAGNYAACAVDFAIGVALLDDVTRSAYQSLTHVLAAGDESRFQSSSLEMRDRIQRMLWTDADPDPTSEVNPAQLEHVYRMFMSDCLYAHDPAGRRGWTTDRGEAFVRFGRPLEIEYTMGDIPASGKVETWSWNTHGLFHQLVFVDEYLNGNPRIPYRADITLHFMRHTQAASTLGLEAVPIPALLDAYAFRDASMTTSVYAALAVDAEALHRVVDVSKLDNFVVRSAYFDDTWVREGGFVDSVRVGQVSENHAPRGRTYEVVRRLRVPCDRYHLSMAFEDDQVLSRAVARGDVDALRFLSDGLSMSDVLLYRDDSAGDNGSVIERGGMRMHPKIQARYAPGEHVRAYVEVYDLALSTHDGVRASLYDLRFAIFPARDDEDPEWVDWGRRAVEWAGFGDDDEAVMSQTFRRQGRSHDDRETIAIDIDKLEAGRYELLVEVTDRVSGRRALVHTPFEKDAGPVTARERR